MHKALIFKIKIKLETQEITIQIALKEHALNMKIFWTTMSGTTPLTLDRFKQG